MKTTTFTRADYIKALQDQTGFAKEACASMLEAFLEATISALGEGKEIQLRGAWTMKPKMSIAKAARNISTGESVTVPARIEIKTRPSESMLERVRSWKEEEIVENSNPF